MLYMLVCRSSQSRKFVSKCTRLTFSIDIQAKNIIIGARDTSIFSELDKTEESEPSSRKNGDNRIIYQSRPFCRSDWRAIGMPILSDFGLARIGDEHEGLIQPELYRAPEAILGMKWTSKVDIWNVGAMVS